MMYGYRVMKFGNGETETYKLVEVTYNEDGNLIRWHSHSPFIGTTIKHIQDYVEALVSAVYAAEPLTPENFSNEQQKG